jgi:putative aldouronate transport system permease protein
MGNRYLKTGSIHRKTLRDTWPYHLMLLPGIAILAIYTLLPFIGNYIAFMNFQPALGFLKSKWVGVSHFKKMFLLPDTMRVFINTLSIASGKLIFNLLISILFAILLHEMRGRTFKKSVQTIALLPHFLSWVILATVFRNVLDETGVFNTLLMKTGILKSTVVFLGNNNTFRGVIIATDVWKEFGYSAIIFIAALAGINQELYEAAEIDGAGRLRKIWHITLPGIRMTIVLVATLNISSILNAGFDQVFNLYSPIVYKSGDIIDTYVYRMSFINTQYSFATAVGLLKSLISFLLIVTSNFMAARFANYRIF